MSSWLHSIDSLKFMLNYKMDLNIARPPLVKGIALLMIKTE